MRVAVLGSNSFAGCDFVDFLVEQGRYEIIGISRSPEKAGAFLPRSLSSSSQYVYRQFDLNVDVDEIMAVLDVFEPRYIVNFAAQGDDAASWSHPADFFETNCAGLARLLDRLKSRTYIHRFLQISSSSVYGNVARTVTEESSLDPDSPYGVSKAAADYLLRSYYRNIGFPAQMLRPPNLYGPHQQLFRIIPKSIVLLKKGQEIQLHGGGYAVRMYLHVRDASRAALAVLDRGGVGEAYNVSPDEPCRIRDLVALICRELGRDFEANTSASEDRAGQPSGQDLSSSKIRRELGWRPEISLSDGIAGVRAWVEQNWDELVNQPLVYQHRR